MKKGYSRKRFVNMLQHNINAWKKSLPMLITHVNRLFVLESAFGAFEVFGKQVARDEDAA